MTKLSWTDRRCTSWIERVEHNRPFRSHQTNTHMRTRTHSIMPIRTYKRRACVCCVPHCIFLPVGWFCVHVDVVAVVITVIIGRCYRHCRGLHSSTISHAHTSIIRCFAHHCIGDVRICVCNAGQQQHPIGPCFIFIIKPVACGRFYTYLHAEYLRARKEAISAAALRIRFGNQRCNGGSACICIVLPSRAFFTSSPVTAMKMMMMEKHRKYYVFSGTLSHLVMRRDMKDFLLYNACLCEWFGRRYGVDE